MRYDATPKRDSWGRTPDLDSVEHIQALTQKCQKRQDHEPGWNCFVHAPILDMAHTLSRNGGTLGISNM